MTIFALIIIQIRMRYIHIVILYILLFPAHLFAQKGLFFSSEKELSSSLINAIYQDQRNYIWIATEDGLNKYDGIRFTTYKNNLDDSTTIKNNYTRALYEDSRGRFWVGCINALHLYDRNTDKFKEVVLYNDTFRLAPHITYIMESKSGEIWIATSGQGVIRIDEETSMIKRDNEISTRLSSPHLSYIFEDSRGIFWIASENQGLNMYDPRSDEVTIFNAPTLIGSNLISSICEDADGNLFVGTLANGLYKFNAEKKKFEPVLHSNNKVLPIKSLLVDNKNRLLVGTDGEGIKIYNPETNQLDDYHMKSTPFDFSKMKVHAICQDRMGNIWMGLFQQGVFLEPENPNKFNYWGSRGFNQGIIGSDCVMSLLKDKNGNTWIGTNNDGVYRLSESGESTHFAPNANKQSVPSTILSMVEDNNGNIWLGSYLKGLASIDAKSNLCTYYNHSEEHSNSAYNDDNTARNKIFAMEKDNSNKLWIGTNGAGVYVFDLKEKKYIKHYSQYATNENKIPNDWINCIMANDSELIWVGSYNGVFSINTINGDIKHYNRENNILPGNVVYCITEDKNGGIWIGTTEGLARFDKSDGTSTIYTMANGLPSNVICSILEDDENNIWLSTHSGISKFIISEDKFINYYASDGLQGNEFSQGAAVKADNGELFFGGINGVTSFMPSEINDQRIPPNVYLTALYVMDKQVVSEQKSGKNEIFSGFIADVEKIRLSYEDNMFALEFSTFYYGFSERVYYQYVLEGLGSKWMTIEPGVNRISFTNINYGTYKLKVKAAIYDSSSSEKEIILIISPPWYFTWWAKLIYVLLSILLLMGIYRYITERIRHKNEMLRRQHTEQINEGKLQFFINVSHEIRTPMTLVISPLEKLISENKDPAIQKSYLLMYRNAQRILGLINQLMDVRKIDKGLMSVKMSETDIVGFIDDLMQTFEFQADKRHIKFDFTHQEERLYAWIDLNNFDKVLVNILSNAFKFTPEDGEVNIRLSTGKDDSRQDALCDYFEIMISDTGSGIEEDKIEKIFERFYQIDTDINKVNFGTGIGLHLARSLVQLQHGAIYAQNRKGIPGSEFIIRMPMGAGHIKESEKDINKKNQQVDVRNKQLSELSKIINTEEEKPKVKAKTKTKYRILIVDDESEIRNYLMDELADTFKVFEALNGKDALSFILKEKPNLIISDIMMPDMDGISLVKKIKSNVNINHIPVILLTAKATDEDKAEGFETGADGYVTKPFNIELLKKRILNIIENRERLEPKISDSEEKKALIKPVILRSSDEILYEKITKLISENIADPDLNVEFLANGVGISRVHMHRKLKELTNQSARDFIRTIRLNQAADLLGNKNLTISEIAYALGYTNLSHFSNSFREFHGMSPKEYKEKTNHNS